MKIVALTGGIGTGKTQVSDMFAALGVPVIDTDVISRALTTNNLDVLTQIKTQFGADFLLEKGTLNRAKMREHIFNAPAERKKLEQLLHPLIHQEVLRKVEENQKRHHPIYQVVAIPLLFESQRYQDLFSQIVLVDCDEETQIARVKQRSGLSEEEIQKILATQTPSAVKRQGADWVIENSQTLKELHQNVLILHEKLINTCIVRK